MTSLSFNKANFYRCYLIKWRHIIRNLKKNKDKTILTFIDKVSKCNNLET